MSSLPAGVRRFSVAVRRDFSHAKGNHANRRISIAICYLFDMNNKTARPLVGKLAFETSAGGFLGEPRIRLLEAIGVHGSLSRAAKDVPLSYKAAWDALDAMNNLAELPLVVRTTGGLHGGGTQLTDHGRQIIALYRAMESSQQDILNQLAELPHEPPAPQENTSLRTLIRRLSVKTSARNQFVGAVAELTDAGGMVDVRLALHGGDELMASITPESSENMGLALGEEVYALIKAPWVAVSTKPVRASAARNVWPGTVQGVKKGFSSTQVSVATASGRIVAASMPNAKEGELPLKKSQPIWVSFATDSIILATFS